MLKLRLAAGGKANDMCACARAGVDVNEYWEWRRGGGGWEGGRCYPFVNLEICICYNKLSGNLVLEEKGKKTKKKSITLENSILSSFSGQRLTLASTDAAVANHTCYRRLYFKAI